VTHDPRGRVSVDRRQDSVRELAAILDRLAERGPLAYRLLSPEERAWRGRYALMVASIGASALIAWAAALDPVDRSARQARVLVEGTSDLQLMLGLRASHAPIADLLVYGD
jgi:hypothetical protein